MYFDYFYLLRLFFPKYYVTLEVQIKILLQFCHFLINIIGKAKFFSPMNANSNNECFLDK